MDEKAAIRAIAQAIDANASTFVDSLIQNGEERTLEDAHKTMLGSITSYYTCKIRCERKRAGFMPGVSNLNHGTAPRANTYQIAIFVAEAAQMEQSEDDSYITAHDNFRLLVDRITDYFLTSEEWFTDSETSKTFRLPPGDRVVDVENIEPIPEEFPILGSIIRFQLNGCND